MNIGISQWGFIGNHLAEVDTPSGNHWYSGTLINSLLRRGINVYMLQKNRDKKSIDAFGDTNFESHFKRIRKYAYENVIWCREDNVWPKLDILLMEWRWKIPGKNCEVDKDSLDYQEDLDRQNEILNYYKDKNVKLIIWDLDYFLSEEDEQRILDLGYKNVKIIETSFNPKHYIIPRTKVMIPIPFEELFGVATQIPYNIRKIGYIGNPYARSTKQMEIIRKYAKEHPNEVHFVGNWGDDSSEFRKMKLKENMKINPGVNFMPRITPEGFKDFYSRCVICPLLSKDEYSERGFLTARYQEALYFGSLVFGFSDFYGIEKILPKELIVDINDEKSIEEVMNYVCGLGFFQRIALRRKLLDGMKFMDVEYFIDEVLK